MQASSDNADARFTQLERTLEQFQENARYLGVIASDFTSRSQEPFNQKIHTLTSGLQELDQIRQQFNDVRVPLELLNFLDEGKNPQLYTKQVLERTLQKNKEVNGKVEIYKKFRAMLLKELGKEIPEDTLKYRQIREIDSKKKDRLKMTTYRIYAMRPANGFTADTIRFVPHFVALSLNWTYNHPKSEGMEQFIEECYPIIRYRHVRKKAHRVGWCNKEQILSMVEQLSIGGDYRLNREVQRRLPRGIELWDKETMGHDVFKVYSKWKADPPEPNEITTEKHPNFIYKKY
ncbi:hypothetical protein WR25_15443 [Diploscapter pachys]|uniref:Mediator of RNA polymerase II transcription subunit 10 n=1 Tax=Diploscapter pachys TaxID=2018661 RepID=A0A2A2JF77_9BILA|nr:hypothetical protein WR25_15443 [Diploscapter pachys]